MSVLTGESRLQHLRVVVHVLLCVIICSCIFHPSSWFNLVLHFPVLHFPPNLVLHFPVFHFPPSDFWDYWSCFSRSSNFRSSIFSAPLPFIVNCFEQVIMVSKCLSLKTSVLFIDVMLFTYDIAYAENGIPRQRQS